MSLYPHQKQIIKAALRKKAFAIFSDCGTGKTRCVIELIKLNMPCRALVIAPNSVLENWEEEVKEWSSLAPVILRGSKTRRMSLLSSEADIYILNYEALRILEQELINKKFDYIIADEIQKLKGYKSLQSKAAFRIGQRVPYRLGLTGTPITNNPCDIFGEYRFLDPFIFGFSFYRFKNRYAISGGYMNKQIVSYINMDELHDKVHSIAIRVKKEDCLSLPQKIYQIYHINLTDEQRRVYTDLRKEFISEIKGRTITAPYVLTRLMRLSQITAGFIKDESAREINFDSNPKLKWLKDFIEDLPKDEKVVIFFRFIKELRNLQALFTAMNIKFTEMYGATKDRQDRINKFNKGDTRIFLGQIETSGIGINLHSARYCVFLSNSYSHGTRIQAEERLHRIGQTRDVVYLDILARHTVDETILKCLKNKADLAMTILEEVDE